MTWLLTVAGALLVLLALRDIFHTLWHPSGFGTLARLVFRACGGRPAGCGPSWPVRWVSSRSR